MSAEDAVQLVTDKQNEYKVAGYGRKDDGYGGPYHPDAFNDPKVNYALAGSPEDQAQWHEDLKALDEARVSNGDTLDKVDLVAASAHSTVIEDQPYRAAAQTPELEATADNVEEAAARKHLIQPSSNESATDATERTTENIVLEDGNVSGSDAPNDPSSNDNGDSESTVTDLQFTDVEPTTEGSTSSSNS